MWAEGVATGRYRLRNSPFYAHDVSAEDVVFTKLADGYENTQAVHGSPQPLSFDGVSMRAVILPIDFCGFRGQRRRAVFGAWRPLQALGCSYEQANATRYAVDVPPHVDIHAAYRLLEEGESKGIWSFEEVAVASSGFVNPFARS